MLFKLKLVGIIMEIEVLRDEVIEKVKDGVLPDKSLIELYDNVKDLELKQKEDYDIQIKALNDDYIDIEIE